MPSCDQPNCKFPDGGTCLEGQGTKCPHYHSEEEPKVVEKSSSEALPPKNPVTALYAGNKMSQVECAKFFLSGFPKVISIAGAKDCGKTTLLARIHEYFHEGPVAGYAFAGSRTLMSFGLISWNAMRASKRFKADTERSKKIEVNHYLHLKLRNSTSFQTTDLLLYDIPGEVFTDAASHGPTISAMHGLWRSDHFVMCIDGEAMVDLSARQVQIRNCRDFLKMAIQCGQIGKNTIVDFVLTKLDVLVKGDSQELEFAMKKITEIIAEFGSEFASVDTWEIAARPDSGFDETSNDIQQLFLSWIETSRRNEMQSLSNAPKMNYSRDFCRFGQFSES